MPIYKTKQVIFKKASPLNICIDSQTPLIKSLTFYKRPFNERRPLESIEAVYIRLK